MLFIFQEPVQERHIFLRRFFFEGFGSWFFSQPAPAPRSHKHPAPTGSGSPALLSWLTNLPRNHIEGKLGQLGYSHPSDFGWQDKPIAWLGLKPRQLPQVTQDIPSSLVNPHPATSFSQIIYTACRRTKHPYQEK